MRQTDNITIWDGRAVHVEIACDITRIYITAAGQVAAHVEGYVERMPWCCGSHANVGILGDIKWRVGTDGVNKVACNGCVACANGGRYVARASSYEIDKHVIGLGHRQSDGKDSVAS